MFFTRPSVFQSVSPSVLFFFCQHNSSEAAQQNFLKLFSDCSDEGHTMKMRISTGNFDSILFLK